MVCGASDSLYCSFWRDPRKLTDCVSGLNPFLLARCHCTAPQRGNHLCWLFVSCVGEYDGTVVVGRSTVCDDIATRLLFVSPVTPTWCYVLRGVRLPAVVLVQSLQIVAGAMVWHDVDVSGTVMYEGACKVVRLLIEVLAVCVLQIVWTLFFYAVVSCGIDVWTVAVDVACYSCVGSHVSGSSMWSGKELWLRQSALGPCTASCMDLVSVMPCRVALTPGQWLYRCEVSLRGSHVVDWDVPVRVLADAPSPSPSPSQSPQSPSSCEHLRSWLVHSGPTSICLARAQHPKHPSRRLGISPLQSHEFAAVFTCQHLLQRRKIVDLGAQYGKHLPPERHRQTKAPSEARAAQIETVSHARRHSPLSPSFVPYMELV